MADSTTAPSTPARSASGSSSPPQSTTSTTATSTEKQPQQGSKLSPLLSPSSSPSQSTQEDTEMQQIIQEPSSELEIVEPEPKEQDEPNEAKGKKRKAPISKSVAPSSKKSKPSSTSTSNAKASTSKSTSTSSTPASSKPSSGVEVEVKNELVGFKNGKLSHKQKTGPNHQVVTSYLIGRAAFIEWAVDHFKNQSSSDGGDGSSEKLSEIPDEHLGALAKDIQESSLLLGGLARSIAKSLASSINENLSALQDSQDATDSTDSIDKILERIDLDGLKKSIEGIAKRKNYGLSLEDLKDETLPDGLSSIPNGLQFWVWEVDEDRFKDLLSSELVVKLERRRNERQEIKRSVTELFQSLPEEDQTSLLLSSGNNKKDVKGKGKVVVSKGKGKGKGKAKEDDDEEDENEEEGEDGGEKKVKKTKAAVGTGAVGGGGGKKKKELTEEERAEKEEKQRIKLEKEAEKESKRLEREAKKALKAEKDAAEEEKKAQRRKEKEEKKQVEEKKLNALKSQKNLMSNFFVTKTTSPQPTTTSGSTSPGPSTTSNAATPATLNIPAAAAASTSSSSKDVTRSTFGGGGDFNKVFHPFTVKPGMEVAPLNRYRKGKKSIVEVEVDGDDSITLKDSLRSLVSKVPKRRIPPYNPYPTPAVSVRHAVVGLSDSALTSQDTSGFYEVLKDRSKIPVKLLKFAEDVRPGYIGTWSKTSKVVTPRTPFGRDGALLNYDHDSEAEWEEEPDDPDAENVGSEGELSNDELEDGATSEADSWLAEDDEIEYEAGYDAEGDIVMMSADGRTPLEDDDDDCVIVEGEKEKKERLKREKDKKKRLEEKQKKRRAAGPLLPLIKGPIWEVQERKAEVVLKEPAFKSMKIRFLNDASSGLNPLTYVSKSLHVAKASVVQTASSSSSAPLTLQQQQSKGKGKENISIGTTSSPAPASAPSTTSSTTDSKKRPSKPFPDNLLRTFLYDINGSDKPQPVIIDDFVRKQKEDGVVITKASCQAKWKEMGIKKTKGKMVVPDALLTQHGLSV